MSLATLVDRDLSVASSASRARLKSGARPTLVAIDLGAELSSFTAAMDQGAVEYPTGSSVSQRPSERWTNPKMGFAPDL